MSAPINRNSPRGNQGLPNTASDKQEPGAQNTGESAYGFQPPPQDGPVPGYAANQPGDYLPAKRSPMLPPLSPRASTTTENSTSDTNSSRRLSESDAPPPPQGEADDKPSRWPKAPSWLRNTTSTCCAATIAFLFLILRPVTGLVGGSFAALLNVGRNVSGSFLGGVGEFFGNIVIKHGTKIACGLTLEAGNGARNISGFGIAGLVTFACVIGLSLGYIACVPLELLNAGWNFVGVVCAGTAALAVAAWRYVGGGSVGILGEVGNALRNLAGVGVGLGLGALSLARNLVGAVSGFVLEGCNAARNAIGTACAVTVALLAVPWRIVGHCTGVAFVIAAVATKVAYAAVGFTFGTFIIACKLFRSVMSLIPEVLNFVRNAVGVGVAIVATPLALTWKFCGFALGSTLEVANMARHATGVVCGVACGALLGLLWGGLKTYNSVYQQVRYNFLFGNKPYFSEECGNTWSAVKNHDIFGGEKSYWQIATDTFGNVNRSSLFGDEPYSEQIGQAWTYCMGGSSTGDIVQKTWQNAKNAFHDANDSSPFGQRSYSTVCVNTYNAVTQSSVFDVQTSLLVQMWEAYDAVNYSSIFGSTPWWSEQAGKTFTAVNNYEIFGGQENCLKQAKNAFTFANRSEFFGDTAYIEQIGQTFKAVMDSSLFYGTLGTPFTDVIVSTFHNINLDPIFGSEPYWSKQCLSTFKTVPNSTIFGGKRTWKEKLGSVFTSINRSKVFGDEPYTEQKGKLFTWVGNRLGGPYKGEECGRFYRAINRSTFFGNKPWAEQAPAAQTFAFFAGHEFTAGPKVWIEQGSTVYKLVQKHASILLTGFSGVVEGIILFVPHLGISLVTAFFGGLKKDGIPGAALNLFVGGFRSLRYVFWRSAERNIQNLENPGARMFSAFRDDMAENWAAEESNLSERYLNS